MVLPSSSSRQHGLLPMEFASAYNLIKVGRILLWAAYCFLFVWLTPVWLESSARWIEVAALIINLPLAIAGPINLWNVETPEPEKRLPIRAGAGRARLCLGVFGVIVAAQIVRRWLSL